jgi:hypothetical protein
MAPMQKSDKILGRFPGPVTLYPSRLWVAGMLLMSPIAVVFLGFYVSGELGSTRPHGAYDTFMGWAALILFAGLAVGALVTLLFPNTICLKLDADGFEIHRFSGTERRRWRDVRHFDIRTTRLPKSDLEQVAFTTTGGDGVLPNNYGLGLQELLRLMKAWCERATTAV